MATTIKPVPAKVPARATENVRPLPLGVISKRIDDARQAVHGYLVGCHFDSALAPKIARAIRHLRKAARSIESAKEIDRWSGRHSASR